MLGMIAVSLAVWLAPNVSGGYPELAGYEPVQKIMIFGGPGHDTYLGCLSCSEYSSDSVFNEFGTYGSRYSANSIFNQFGRFGSPYSQYSACNPYASDPPVIVDEDGEFYGRLTVNRFHSQVVKDSRVLEWLEEVVCEA